MDQLRPAVRKVFQRGARRPGVSLAFALAVSIALFASLDAGRSRPAPLRATYPSPDAMAQAVLTAVEANDIERLRALAVTEQEFRSHVWPELPASRPERNVPFDFVWEMLQRNSESHLRQTLSKFQSQPLTLVRMEFSGETTDYDGVTVRRDTRLVVKDGAGNERIVRLFGSTIEQRGRYKVFSYVVD